MKKYYKYIIGIIVVIGLILCVKSCADKKTSDVTIAYIGNNFVNRELFESNIGTVTDNCADVNGDGKFFVELMEISFNESLNYADKSNSDKKLANAVGMGTARLFIIDKAHLLANKDAGVFQNLFCLGEGITNSLGETVGISVQGNKVLERLGVDATEDLYLAIRVVSEVDEVMDKNVKKKDEAVKVMAEAILN